MQSAAVAIDDEAVDVGQLRRWRKDLKDAVAALGPAAARYLVDSYYATQKLRIHCGNQARAQAEQPEPNAFVLLLAQNFAAIEADIRKALDVYSDQSTVGRWSKSIVGIGPVLAAGLLAHIDITRAPTVGHIWRFAGLDPTQEWGKGERRPWNAQLKTLCWKIGQSFIKVQARPADVYGKVYATRRQQENERNAAGLFAAQAARQLAQKRIQDPKLRATLEAGRLSDGHLLARSQRYATKLFLAHWWQVARESNGLDCPKPWVITHGGHVHFTAPPNWPLR